MSERTIHIIEAEPGIVHITTEALHGLLISAGFRKRGEHEYVTNDEQAAGLATTPHPKPKPTARPPHPATMIGRTNRAVCLLDADCIAGVDHDGECIQ